MNEDPIEERLARMQPAPLPNDVMARLIAARPQPAERAARISPWAWFGGVAAALGLLVAALFVAGKIPRQTGPNFAGLAAATPEATLAPQPSRIFLPVEEHNYLVGAEDLGILAADTPHPVRLVRTLWVDDAIFRGTDGASQARLTQPRERIIPVSLETY